jgi:glycosyltransferase involved in cell wall biosynthesis
MGYRTLKNNIRPIIDGKFFRIGEQRLYIKGCTYGTFAPDENGFQFPKLEKVAIDFLAMSEAGINTVRVYTIPSIEILNLALAHGLYVMVGLPWEQHLTFLDSKKRQREIIEKIKHNVTSCEKHAAIVCYAIGNEIPSQMVRWYGDKKISRFLKKMFKAVKSVDPEGLITYVNYPTTEYLALPFLDFDCFNVYLETEEKLINYLARLHNLTGDKPLVLAEIGLDSIRNGEEKQAEMLDWQIRTIFEKGCAGTFVFSWTDEWWRGGDEIEDWDFGLVDRDRNPKPALKVIEKVFSEVPFATKKELPKISVVVCSYNGATTIKDTMEGLQQLDYPNFEVIVVNDGSNDNTSKIASEYDFRLISTENGGLSNARNIGMHAATGDIVAYIDDDAYPDPHWLTYLASGYMTSDHAGMGGPNIKPFGDGPIADCVGNSPGGPLHVLTTDEIAEHIPGCNMSFRRDALLEIGGFDPVFRAAGDDVDVCWRIQEKGYTIGFHPSAFVWHHCRNSFKMYWKQQQGYGKAEALLERKWPKKYNVFGHLTWNGRIYGNGLTNPLKGKKKKIFYGSQGTALFQSVYQPATGVLSALPLMPEWYLWILFLTGLSFLGIEWPPLLWAIPILSLSVLIVFIQAGISASHAKFVNKPDTAYRKLKYWGLTTFMHIAQPVARLKGRIVHGLTPWNGGLRYIKHVNVLFKSKKLVHWSEKWRSVDEWLGTIETGLIKLNNKVKKGNDFDRWDLQNRSGLFAAVRSLLTIEEHGMGKQYLKFKTKLSVSGFGLTLLLALACLSCLAFLNQAFISGSFLTVFAVLIGLKIVADCSGAKASVRNIVKELPDGVAEIELDQSLKEKEQQEIELQHTLNEG